MLLKRNLKELVQERLCPGSFVVSRALGYGYRNVKYPRVGRKSIATKLIPLSLKDSKLVEGKPRGFFIINYWGSHDWENLQMEVVSFEELLNTLKQNVSKNKKY